MDSERLPSEGVPVRTMGEMSGKRATRALLNTTQERGEDTAQGAQQPKVAAEPGARRPAQRRPLGAGRCQRCQGPRGRCHQRAPCATGQEGPGRGHGAGGQRGAPRGEPGAGGQRGSQGAGAPAGRAPGQARGQARTAAGRRQPGRCRAGGGSRGEGGRAPGRGGTGRDGRARGAHAGGRGDTHYGSLVKRGLRGGWYPYR